MTRFLVVPEYKAGTNRHIVTMANPWLRSGCHACDREIGHGETLYLDTDGGLFCSFYCVNSRPNPGAGARTQ